VRQYILVVAILNYDLVRLATHPTFKTFVEENSLEFFSIGGDPAELMAFMVKNPGLMPGIDSLKSGDVGERRRGMYDIVKGEVFGRRARGIEGIVFWELLLRQL